MDLLFLELFNAFDNHDLFDVINDLSNDRDNLTNYSVDPSDMSVISRMN
jgi:hypothetical protein